MYLAMESLVDAGVQMGFPRPTAVKLVQNTFLGAAAQAVGYILFLRTWKEFHKFLFNRNRSASSPNAE